ncbi:MAG: DUF6249 domain-containing protein [Verrucomicrobiota bacterium]
MKSSFLCCLASITLLVSASGQTPTPFSSPGLTASPASVATTSVTPTVSPAISPAPSATISASPDEDFDRDIDSAIEKKIRKHFNFTIDGDHSKSHSGVDSDVPWIAIPIVLIVFLCIFGLPVSIVALIMYFSFSKSRAMHRTVRMMVEKGQPVPESLLNPPPVIRQRSDLRRGVVLLMVGTGLMVFFGAVNDWEGGAWSLGIIPFLIGLGYLLVWKLDVRREDTSPKV